LRGRGEHKQRRTEREKSRRSIGEEKTGKRGGGGKGSSCKKAQDEPLDRKNANLKILGFWGECLPISVLIEKCRGDNGLGKQSGDRGPMIGRNFV